VLGALAEIRVLRYNRLLNMQRDCFMDCYHFIILAIALALGNVGRASAKDALAREPSGPANGASLRELEYVPSNDTTDSCTDAFGDTGRCLVDGLRFAPAEGVAADTSASGVLEDGIAIPSRLGAGFLFWDHHSLYSATTFTGRLVHEGTFPPLARSSVWGLVHPTR